MKARPVRPISQLQYDKIVDAVSYLLLARNALWFAECPLSLRKVKSALKSAKGALCHAERRRMHTPGRGCDPLDPLNLLIGRDYHEARHGNNYRFITWDGNRPVRRWGFYNGDGKEVWMCRKRAQTLTLLPNR